MKPTKRKAFNFMRSYFDVYNELKTNNDKLAFLDAIINKQFLDIDPKNLSFLPNLCYESQRHAIESSVNGWKRANKTTSMTTLGTDPPTDPPTNPKEEEEEEKVEEKVQYVYPTLEEFMVFVKGELSDDYYKTKRDKLIRKYKAWNIDGWINRRTNKPIKNWKSTILNTVDHL